MAKLEDWFKLTKRVVVAAQLLAFAGALLFQGIAHSVEAVAPDSTVQTSGESKARAHDLLTCQLCTPLPAHAPDVDPESLCEGSGSAPSRLLLNAAPEQLANLGLFSRAPPAPGA